MRSTIRFGRIAGIPVGAHWSLLVIAGLLTVSLATGLLPAAVPGAAGSYWAAAVLGAAAFLASIVAHELSHAMVARHHGQRVESITLWLFGGVARLGGDAPSPRAELQVALAGPAASLGLAGVFLGAGWAGSAAGLGDLLVVILTWLGLVNAVLGVFNLLPGAPLDGGRVLAALLWMRGGDRTRAQVTAAGAGTVVGWILVAAGAANLLLGLPSGSLWTVLIGMFIVGASRAEAAAARLRGRLESRRVRDVMTPDPPAVRDWLTVDDLPDELGPGNTHRIVLLTRFAGDVGGVLDLAALRRLPHAAREGRPLRELGIPREELATAAPDEPAAPVVFERAGTGHVVVVLDGDRVVGIVGPAEIDRLLAGRGEPTPV